MKLSCIYLVTANSKWLLKEGLPQLIKNIRLPQDNYEVIIVFNGFEEEFKDDINKLKQQKFLISAPLWVAKGYNLGASKAQGEYLAFFHDDATVKSPYWLDIVLEEFKNSPGLFALSPELALQDLTNFGLENISFLRCVPLIIKKSNFLKCGKFDEHYFFGFEDIDFSYNMLQNNYKFKQATFDYEHYKGSSTVSILGSLKDFYQEFNFISLNYINAKYFAEKFNLPFKMKLYKEEGIQVHDLEILNNNKKDFADLIKAFYFLRKNKPKDSIIILNVLEKKYKDNFFFKKITEKLNF